MTLPVSVIKSRQQKGGGDEGNIWMTFLYDNYYDRPSLPDFSDMCMAEFVSTYRFLTKSSSTKSSIAFHVFQLERSLGFIKRRKHR